MDNKDLKKLEAGHEVKLNVLIRKADSNDIPCIKKCAEEAFSGYVARIGKKPAPMYADFDRQVNEGAIFIIGNKEEMYGYVVFYITGKKMHLESIAIRPKYQHLGLGNMLLRFVEEQGREKGCVFIELYTNLKMYENISMYQKLGYVEVNRYMEDGYDRVYFRKLL